MIITSPETSNVNQGTLFLGGGITGCPDWQSSIKNQLSKYFTVFNPRREGWNIYAYADESIKQIHWEHKHLQQSEIILFWFPKETLCPITLFELGKYLMTDKKLYIGTHFEYVRRLDVIEQTNLIRPNTTIWSNLDEMVSAIIDELTD